MGSITSSIRGLSAADRSAAVSRAAGALAAFRPVILPTETVYGVAVNAQDRGALDRFAALRRPGLEPDPGKPWLGRSPWTWHAPSIAAVTAAIPFTRPIHRRLLERLAPGPVRFVFELSPSEAGNVERVLGVMPGVLDGPGWSGSTLGKGATSDEPEGQRTRSIAVRIPRHEISAAVLAMVPAPVVIERLSRFGWGESPSSPGLVEMAAGAGIGMVIDDGPSDERRTSTSIVLRREGYRVLEAGAVSERAVKRAATRTVLFVCTGNTCRSPMAAATAQHLLQTEPTLSTSGIETVALSAGVAASEGQPATPDAVDALADLGVRAKPHRSQQLTRSLIDDADRIYVMTGAHRNAVLAIDRSSGPKISLLDPDGADIPDPYGGPRAVYASAARRILGIVRGRLAELDSDSGIS